jgi:hypothetical protein
MKADFLGTVQRRRTNAKENLAAGNDRCDEIAATNVLRLRHGKRRQRNSRAWVNAGTRLAKRIEFEGMCHCTQHKRRL